MEKLKGFIKRHGRLYVMAKCFCSINDPNLLKLMKGFYGSDNSDSDTLLIEHYGQKFPDTLVYNMSIGEKDVSVTGLGARLHQLLYRLRFSDFINAKPRVFWGNKMAYYDKQMDKETKNVFEYYFEPVSDLSNYPVSDFRNVINSQGRHTKFYQNMDTDSYCIKEEHLKILSEQYKKSITLNSKTKEFIYNGIKETVAGQKTLGVHVRGTDFNLGLCNHPIVVSLRDYLDKAKEIFGTGKYDKIFLATDDLNAIELFAREFSSKLVYYEDTFRTRDTTGPHSTSSERPFHHYRLGLEVLRDIYTLANCDGLVCGLSHVSFAARYVSLALDRKFAEVIVLDKGINRKEKRKLNKKKPKV